MKQLLILFLTLSVFNLSAQDAREKEVMKVIDQLFEAMRTNDSTLLKSCFAENASSYTLFKDPAGTSQLRQGSVQRFADAVGQPKSDVWNEPIWNEKVHIDGPLAAVWVDYAFYLNNQFLHCGVDAFQLIETEEGWKIFHLADTRRKSDCVIPDEVKAKFE